MLDPFDPNTWPLQTHEFRVYGDDNAQTWAVVDEQDYQWAVQWRWCWKKSRGGKLYLRRAVTDCHKGVRLGNRTLYLHVEIMKRTGIEPVTKGHELVDHRNGNSQDDRRKNLRWATHSMNSKNLFGKYAHDLMEDVA